MEHMITFPWGDVRVILEHMITFPWGDVRVVLEHMITFPWGDVRVIFLWQVSIDLSFIFLMESKKLPGSPLCKCPMKSVQSFCSEHVHIEFHGDGAPEARE